MTGYRLELYGPGWFASGVLLGMAGLEPFGSLFVIAGTVAFVGAAIL